MAEVFTFAEYPGRTLHVLLFCNVANAFDLREAVFKKTLDVALLSAERVPGLFPLQQAAFRALYYQVDVKKLRASTLNAELIHCLYAGRNVRDALVHYGASEASRDLLVCVFDLSAEAKEALIATVQGQRVSLEEYYPSRIDWSVVTAAYGLSPEELGSKTPEDYEAAVCGRISVQEML